MSPITFTVEFPIVIEVRDGYFLASCSSLEVHAEGKTHDAAKGHIVEALDAFISTCLEMGTLEKVLRDSGYKKVAHEDNCKPDLNEEFVSVPFSLLAASNLGRAQTYAH